jgi:hypothetical protein
MARASLEGALEPGVAAAQREVLRLHAALRRAPTWAGIQVIRAAALDVAGPGQALLYSPGAGRALC